MIRVVIVDDCEEFSNEIYNITKQYYEDKRIAASIRIYNKSQMLKYDLSEQIRYDIYFLDIEMPEINGLQLAKEIRKTDENAIIIFVTSYLKYSIVGYELGIYRYIPKDNISKKLVPALESASREVNRATEQVYIVSTNTKCEKIKYEDMLYIYKDRKYSIICCDNAAYKVRKSLRQVYEELNQYGQKQFIFIERGYIANIVQIKKVQNGEVIMQNGELLNIGRSFYSTVKQEVAEYWSGM